MGGRAPDGRYYGPDARLGPGEVEWLPPYDEPVDVDEVPLPPDDDAQPSYREERYSGTVGGVNYRDSERPGSNAYHQTHGVKTPLQIPCDPPPTGCGAAVGDKCTFALDRVTGELGNRKRTTVTGERHMACRTRQLRADKST